MKTSLQLSNGPLCSCSNPSQLSEQGMSKQYEKTAEMASPKVQYGTQVSIWIEVSI